MYPAETHFFVTGGSLRTDTPSYVERRADRELLEALRRGEFCYVLTSRQMGKSSLMVRTAARLREAGVRVAVLDLTAIGQNLGPEQWYYGLLCRLGEQLDLEDALDDYWTAHERMGPLQRFVGALREVVLAGIQVDRYSGIQGEAQPEYPNTRIPEYPSVVIFVDEIDIVRSLRFSTDEFFAAIRECYNRRVEEPQFERLTFCLLGVATPSDLIQDVAMTPFNIGRRVELTDFTPAEASLFAVGLALGTTGDMGRSKELARSLLQRVLHWTDGHPYLTQRLCQAVAERPEVRDMRGVDRLCEELFLSHRARERDDNLLFVRDRMLRSGVPLESLLDFYADVRRGYRPRAEESNPLVSILRLVGIAAVQDGRLVLRNRIYARVFDLAWVRANMPDAELRRQKAAFRRGVRHALGIYVCAGLAVTLAGIVGWQVRNVNPVVAVPPPAKLPKPNAYDLYAAAGRFLDESRRLGLHPLPNDPDNPEVDLELLRAAVADGSPALDTLRRGFRLPCVVPGYRSFDAAGPRWLHLRQLGRLVCADGRLKADAGDWPGATVSFLDAARLGTDLGHGSSLVGSMIGVLIEGMSQPRLWQAIEHLGAAQARRAASRLEAIDAGRVPLSRVIEEEKWSCTAMVLNVPGDWGGRLMAEIGSPVNGPVDYLREWAEFLRWSKSDMIRSYLGAMDRYIARLRRPYAGEPFEQQIPRDPLSQMAVPNWVQAWTGGLSKESQTHMLIAALALRAYRLEQGTYPEALAALVPGYLKQVPTDPWLLTRPVQYRKTATGYQLYCVGPDGRDDGGRPISVNVTPDSQGDIVPLAREGASPESR